MSDLNARRYELLYIISATFTDEEAGEIETRVAGLITKVGATADSTTRLGKLRFAYPIKDQRHGYYVQVMISAEPAAVAKLDMQLRITPEVLRHLILSAEEAGSESKYELVQFVEVDINSKEDRPRRRVSAEAKDGEVKEGEVKTEGEAKPEGEVKVEAEAELSSVATAKVEPTV